MDAVPLFFVLGVLARLCRSDLKLPSSLYEVLSIYCLLAIGLKGGVQLAQQDSMNIIPLALIIMSMGFLLPLLAFPVLRCRFDRPNAAAIAAHYGSVSVVTYAIANTFLAQHQIEVDAVMPLALVLLEAPGLIVGTVLAKFPGTHTTGPSKQSSTQLLRDLSVILREVAFGKSIMLLMGGLVIGWLAGPAGIEPIAPVFMAPFKGALCLFLLEMGLVAGGRFKDLRRAGLFLISFGLIWPILSALVGLFFAYFLNLGLGGAVVLMTLAASASYIAAPAAMRLAVPAANPALSIGASLGITFPFNITVGIPMYYAIAQWAYR